MSLNSQAMVSVTVASVSVMKDGLGMLASTQLTVIDLQKGRFHSQSHLFSTVFNPTILLTGF